MPNPQISTQDWFYHAPLAKPQGPSCTAAPVTSQIPGLNNTPEDSTKEQDQNCFRRKWIRDTDSKYVKLAKAGGRKHLLTFNNNSKLSSEPVLYPRVDWFDHHVHSEEVGQQQNEQNITANCNVLPEWYVHEKPLDNNEGPKEENCETANTSSKRPMLGFDSMSAWQRENQLQVLSTKKSSISKSVQLPKIKQPGTTKVNLPVAKKSVKLPKIKSHQHSSEMDQDMTRLLSMDYQREWLLNKSLEDSKEIKGKQTIQKEKQERQKRIADHHRQSLRPRKEIVEEKPLFKLSRFNKVKPCVDSRRPQLQSQSLDKSVAN